MAQKLCNRIFILGFLLANNLLSAQQADPAKERITEAAANYFALDRENIHLQLDKNIFTANEEIWFKGYVFDRKYNSPFFVTSNVFAILMDENGNKISQKLLFANTGSFSGSFKTDRKYKSGYYYIQVYTNWMNNFTEDESSVYKIRIVNSGDASPKIIEKADLSKINITFQPEGGNLIEGITNTIGIRATDCNGNPVGVGEAEIFNAKGETVGKVFTNGSGFGKFDLLMTGETFKVVYQVNNYYKTETVLPKPVKSGIALEVNNYAVANKTVIKVKTNGATLNALQNKLLYLVIQQDDKVTIADINFQGANQKDFILPNDYFFSGTNTIRVLDGALHQMAERLIYSYPGDETVKSNIQPNGRSGGHIDFLGKLNYGNANLSISILPEKSLLLSGTKDIYSDFLLNPYLTENVADAAYYFENPSKSKKYELDLLLLNQKSGKYNWDDILSNPPKKDYEFDQGLTIKGTLNQPLKNREKFKIRIYSFYSKIIDFSEIGEKNDFSFRNIVIADSSLISMSLVRMPKFETEPLKYLAHVENGNRHFNKPFVPQRPVCEPQFLNMNYAFDFPEFRKDLIILDEVEIEQQKNALKRQNILGNSGLRGYKIKESDTMEVLTYIGNNGFNVSKTGDVTITGRTQNTIHGGATTPVVYLDDMKLMSFDQLTGMTMDELDEIYLNPHTIVPGVSNNEGVIRMYRKKPTYKEYKNDTEPYKIIGGFSKIFPFENADYVSFSDNGFQNFGVINWIPMLLTEENGDFKFRIPDYGQKTVKVIIEGFTIEGKPISEIKTISLE